VVSGNSTITSSTSSSTSASASASTSTRSTFTNVSQRGVATSMLAVYAVPSIGSFCAAASFEMPWMRCSPKAMPWACARSTIGFQLP